MFVDTAKVSLKAGKVATAPFLFAMKSISQRAAQTVATAAKAVQLFFVPIKIQIHYLIFVLILNGKLKMVKMALARALPVAQAKT